MRKYSHKPDEKGLASIRQITDQSYRSKPAKMAAAEAARNPLFFRRCCWDAQSLAALAYAFDAPKSEVLDLLAEACRHSAKALQYGVTMDNALYTASLALALLTGNAQFQQSLQSLSRDDFTNPNIISDEIIYLGSEAYRDLAAGRDDAARKSVAAGLARAVSGDVDADAKDVMMPVLLIEQAILDKNAAKLAEAVKARHEEICKSYTPKDGRNEPTALLDIVGLGLLRIAKARRIPDPPASVYLPIELL